MYKFCVYSYYVNNHYKICQMPYLFCDTLEEANSTIKEYENFMAENNIPKGYPKLFIKSIDKFNTI